MFAEKLKLFQRTRLHQESWRYTSFPTHTLHFTAHTRYLCFELPQALPNNPHPLQTTHLYVIKFMKDTSHERIYITDKGYPTYWRHRWSKDPPTLGGSSASTSWTYQLQDSYPPVNPSSHNQSTTTYRHWLRTNMGYVVRRIPCMLLTLTTPLLLNVM